MNYNQLFTVNHLLINNSINIKAFDHFNQRLYQIFPLKELIIRGGYYSVCHLIDNKRSLKKDIPRIELGLSDSKSNVITITQYVLADRLIKPTFYFTLS